MSNLPRSDPLRPTAPRFAAPSRAVRGFKLVEGDVDALKIDSRSVDLAGMAEGQAIILSGSTLKAGTATAQTVAHTHPAGEISGTINAALHGVLTGGDGTAADHTDLARRGGRSLGQQIVGGLIAGEFLDLRGNAANLTDPVRLLSPLRLPAQPNMRIQDEPGNTRLLFNDGIRHRNMVVELDNMYDQVDGASAIFIGSTSGASVGVQLGLDAELSCNTTAVTGSLAAFRALYTFSGTGAPLTARALDFRMTWSGQDAQANVVMGGRISAERTNANTVPALIGLVAFAKDISQDGGINDLTAFESQRDGNAAVIGRTVHARQPVSILNLTPLSIGVDIENQGKSLNVTGVPTVIGARIQGQRAALTTGTAVGLEIAAMLAGGTKFGIRQLSGSDMNRFSGPTTFGGITPTSGFIADIFGSLRTTVDTLMQAAGTDPYRWKPVRTVAPALADMAIGDLAFGLATGPAGLDELFWKPNASRISRFQAVATIV